MGYASTNLGGLLLASRLMDMAENVLAESRPELDENKRFALLESAFRTAIRVQRITADTPVVPSVSDYSVFEETGLSLRASKVIREAHAHIFVLGRVEDLYFGNDREMRAEIDALTRNCMDIKGKAGDA